MGHTDSKAVHTAVMPEILVTRDDEVLLVRGRERGAVFWWPPGAYWVEAGTCDLTTTDPAAWIDQVLEDQIHVTPREVVLRGVSVIDAHHAPVLIYTADIEGDPEPNPALGFDRVGFFAPEALPAQLGRDEQHAAWLRSMVDQHLDAA